jgi:hypothetical protein
MMAAATVLAGAALAFVGGLLASAGATRRWWRLGAALAVAVVAAGAWWVLSADGEAVSLAAHDAQGRPVETTVVVEPAEGAREVRRLSLRQPAPTVPWALAAMGALGLVAAAGARRRAAAVLPVAGAAAALGALMLAGGSGAGEAGVRAALERLDVASLGLRIASFTVPESGWSYATPLVAAVVAALAAALLVLVIGDGAKTVSAAGPLVAFGAALAALGVVARIFAVDGLPWRPVEGALWAAALLVAGAALERASAARRASLAGVGLAVAALALAVAA